MIKKLNTKSPCTKSCNLDKEKNICISCNRTIDEIIKWKNLSNVKKHFINIDIKFR